MAQLWLRGAAYIADEGQNEYHGVAVYASEVDCREHEEQPMFIIPLDCTTSADIVKVWDAIRVGAIPVPLTAERNPESYEELAESMKY